MNAKVKNEYYESVEQTRFAGFSFNATAMQQQCKVTNFLPTFLLIFAIDKKKSKKKC
jgi:hypothetical protein